MGKKQRDLVRDVLAAALLVWILCLAFIGGANAVLVITAVLSGYYWASRLNPAKTSVE